MNHRVSSFLPNNKWLMDDINWNQKFGDRVSIRDTGGITSADQISAIYRDVAIMNAIEIGGAALAAAGVSAAVIKIINKIKKNKAQKAAGKYLTNDEYKKLMYERGALIKAMKGQDKSKIKSAVKKKYGFSEQTLSTEIFDFSIRKGIGLGIGIGAGIAIAPTVIKKVKELIEKANLDKAKQVLQEKIGEMDPEQLRGFVNSIGG